MAKHYKEEEMIRIQIDSVVRPICPECVNHNQIEPGNHDCKNTYGRLEYEPGKFAAKGQCCCYSEEHK